MMIQKSHMTTGTATERWRAAVEANVEKGMSRDKAVLRADKDNPVLREAMLAEHNALHGRRV